MTKIIHSLGYPLVTVLLVIVLVQGCSSLPTDYPRPNSSLLAEHKSTAIGKSFAEEAATHPGKSGFTVVRHGREAFTAHIALTRLATKTLDVQYYIWEPDDTGRILAAAAVRLY